jgi:hypothetical protein
VKDFVSRTTTINYDKKWENNWMGFSALLLVAAEADCPLTMGYLAALVYKEPANSCLLAVSREGQHQAY